MEEREHANELGDAHEEHEERPVSTDTVTGPFTGNATLWVPMWVGGSWVKASFSVDGAGLMKIDKEEEGAETIMHDLCSVPCGPYKSLTTAWKPSATVVEVTTADGSKVLLDALTPDALTHVIENINGIIAARARQQRGGAPTPPSRPDLQPQAKSVVTRVVESISGFIGQKQPNRPPVPQKPAFLRRNQPKLQLDTSSRLWSALHRLRSDLLFIPAHLEQLLQSIRTGISCLLYTSPSPRDRG